MPPQSVIDEARRTGADLRLAGRDFQHSGDRQQWAWSGRDTRFSGLGYPALRGANQLLNASGALAAFEALRGRLPISAQAIRTGLATVELPGRFQVIAGQPALVLDVAHNPHAVAALAQNLDLMGFFPRTHAVFGAMRDKDIGAILAKMAPLVTPRHFTDLAGGACRQRRTARRALRDGGRCTARSDGHDPRQSAGGARCREGHRRPR
jgi:dihydrofolate synthase/folylpolyglutamate synthase